MNNYFFDDFYQSFRSEEGLIELMKSVSEMEATDTWMPGVKTSTIHARGYEQVEIPVLQHEAEQTKFTNHKEFCSTEATELLVETAERTGMVVEAAGKILPVRNTAMSSLHESAKLFGSAFGRMKASTHADVLQEGLNVARGGTLLLIRGGKASAFHSDAAGGYQVMKISDLLATLVNNLSAKFGEVSFISGFNSCGMTQAIFALPDARDKIIDKYADALAAAGGSSLPLAWMPEVVFLSSDTGAACATAIPCFYDEHSHTRVVFSEGVQVKHTKNAGGIQKFSDETEDFWTLFEDAMERAKELADIQVEYPANFCVGICNKLNIPVKWGEKTRSFLEQFQISGQQLSAHDIYIVMSQIPKNAKADGAKDSVVRTLTEQVAKMLKIPELKPFDVGGLVAWK